MIKHYKNENKQYKWSDSQRLNYSKLRGSKTTYIDSNGNTYVLEKDDPMISKLSLKGINSNKVIGFNKLTNKWFWFKLSDFDNIKNILDDDYIYKCPIHGDVYYRFKSRFNRLKIDHKYECKCYKCINEIDNNYEYYKQLTIDFLNQYPKYPGSMELLPYINYVLNKEFPNINEIQIKKYMLKNNIKEIPICIEENCNNRVTFSETAHVFTKHCEKHLYDYKTSIYEKEIHNFLNNLNIKYEIHNNKILNNNLELDAFIPDKNIAIEFNGLYWHSELFKDKFYHYNKWKECYDKKIQLIQIWEDDWKYKQNIVKSLLKAKLNLIEHKIYARKCIIKNVSKNDTEDFLCKNHLQGNSISSINLGLYYNNELVSLMTFSKSRFNKINNAYELIRFCNKLDTIVIGGANKLFNYFLKTFNVNHIFSYSSCDISNGSIYYKLGFNLIKHTGINYWWWKKTIRLNRINFQKYKLIDKGYDKSKTEHEIMNEDGYYKIYGSGNLLFEFKK